MLSLLIAAAFAQEPTTTTEPPPVLMQAPAPTVALFPIRAANVGSAEVRAAEILFRRRYEQALGAATIPEDRIRGAIATADDAGLAAACLALACQTWVTVDVVRLDQEIYVTVVERDGAGTVTQRVETVAAGLDALPIAFDRVARALVQNVPIDQVSTQPVSSAGGPTSTPNPPPAAKRKSKGESLPGFKLGVHGPLWPGFELAMTSAFTWRREKKDQFLEVNVGLTLPLGIGDERTWGMLYGEFGLAHIIPTSAGTAFYAGGGGGLRIGGYDTFGVGLGVYGEAGMMLGRKTARRVYVQGKIGGDAFTGYSEPYVVSYAGLEAGVGF